MNQPQRNLELKDIACYLPYGLTCNVMGEHDNEGNPVKFILRSIENEWVSTFPNKTHNIEFHLYPDCFPLLRPLSSLTKQILIAAGFNTYIDYLSNEREHWIDIFGLEDYINDLSYGHIKWLIKNHYDINGLIECGLAIEIID